MRIWRVAAVLWLAGCSQPAGATDFARSGPAFDPVAFFTGHVTSWGVEENRAGQPIAIVTTDCVGTAVGPQGGSATGSNSIRMVQILHVGQEAPQTRIWQLSRSGPDTYQATANDMAGQTTGTASGRAFHWRWILETSPGESLKNVTMDQWMYRMDDGSVMIRTVVTKFGIRLIEVSELFKK